MTGSNSRVRQIWQRFVALGFRLLYHEMALFYDPVSWAVSLGQWLSWQKTVWRYLPANGTILEVGSGPGHILAELALGGYRVVGLDLSPMMLHLAQRRLRKAGLTTHLCRGRARDLPFAAQAFDAVIATFPTSFIYDPTWISHLIRVLKPCGRFIVVEMASFRQVNAWARCLEWLYEITGQRGPGPDLQELLCAAGLEASRTEAKVEGTTVRLVLGAKGAATRWDLGTSSPDVLTE